MSHNSSSDKSSFAKERHIKFWLRCVKTYLPTGYTSNDSNRMTLAFFIVSALDLLGVLHDRTTAVERGEWVSWIYHCQHPNGGFRGFTGTMSRGKGDGRWDPANLAATFFALVALAVLGDDMEKVKRRECLTWLARLQCLDGSFGEVLDGNGEIEGTRDIRFGYLAAVVRSILKEKEETGKEGATMDVDVDKLAEFVMASKTYDGGIAEAPYHEAQAGFTYCGIATLSLLGKLSTQGCGGRNALNNKATVTQEFIQGTLHWLVNRQTTHLREEEEEEEDEYPVTEPALPPSLAHEQHPPLLPTHKQPLPLIHTLDSPPQPLPPTETLSPLAEFLHVSQRELQWAGFNGRTNKIADTCYSFWAGGTLGILQNVHLLDFKANRRYLLDKTQHVVGGFGKLPGDPPDILHSYLGLAALAIMEEPGLQGLDATLCISVRAMEHLKGLNWRSIGKVALEGGSSVNAADDMGGKYDYMVMSGG